MARSPIVGAALALAAAACLGQSAESLEALPEEQRHEQLLDAIHDAGSLCDELVDARLAEGARPAWRVVCNDALVYLATSEPGSDSLRIAPLPYTDPVVPVPEEPVPELPPAEPPSVLEPLRNE